MGGKESALDFVSAVRFYGEPPTWQDHELVLWGEEQMDSRWKEGDKVFTTTWPYRRSFQNGTVGNNLPKECVSKYLQAIVTFAVEYERMKGCFVELCSNGAGQGEGPYLCMVFSWEIPAGNQGRMQGRGVNTQ